MGFSTAFFASSLNRRRSRLRSVNEQSRIVVHPKAPRAQALSDVSAQRDRGARRWPVRAGIRRRKRPRRRCPARSGWLIRSGNTRPGAADKPAAAQPKSIVRARAVIRLIGGGKNLRGNPALRPRQSGRKPEIQPSDARVGHGLTGKARLRDGWAGEDRWIALAHALYDLSRDLGHSERAGRGPIVGSILSNMARSAAQLHAVEVARGI